MDQPMTVFVSESGVKNCVKDTHGCCKYIVQFFLTSVLAFLAVIFRLQLPLWNFLQ